MIERTRLLAGVVAILELEGAEATQALTDGESGSRRDVNGNGGDTASGARAQDNGASAATLNAKANTVGPTLTEADRLARFNAISSLVGADMAQRLTTFTPNRDVYSFTDFEGAVVTWAELAPGQSFVSVFATKGKRPFRPT